MNKAPGQVAYEAYCKDAGWTSFRGEKLPDWDRQAPEIQAHWAAAENAAVVADQMSRSQENKSP